MKKKFVTVILAISLMTGCLTGCGAALTVAENATNVETDNENLSGKTDNSERHEKSDESQDDAEGDISEEPTKPEGARPDPFEEKEPLSKTDLSSEQLEFKKAIQTKYDELIERHRAEGEDVSLYEGIKVSDSLIKDLDVEGITNIDDFWAFIVQSADETDSSYEGSEGDEKYDLTFLMVVMLSSYDQDVKEAPEGVINKIDGSEVPSSEKQIDSDDLPESKSQG